MKRKYEAPRLVGGVVVPNVLEAVEPAPEDDRGRLHHAQVEGAQLADLGGALLFQIIGQLLNDHVAVRLVALGIGGPFQPIQYHLGEQPVLLEFERRPLP